MIYLICLVGFILFVLLALALCLAAGARLADRSEHHDGPHGGAS